VSDSSDLVIVGASGQGREVAAAAMAAASKEASWRRVRGFVDDNPALAGKTVGALPVLGTTARLERAAALLGVGYPEMKARVHRAVAARVESWPSLVHPHASVGERVSMGMGCFIQAGAVLTCDIALEDFVTVNCGATLNHDLRIARFATLSPGAHIGGNVSIGEGAFVGIGACIIQGVNVGAWSVIGAGAAVIEDVPPNAVVAGVPARVISTRKQDWHLE
jgi:sugar O-acyltransferase (sialic acid O-acetyltransferase NeuD family)